MSRPEYNESPKTLSGGRTGQGVRDVILNLVKTKRKFRQYFIFLPLSILFLSLTAYIFFKLSPDYKFTISNFQIPVLPLFFASLFSFTFSLTAFLLRNRFQGTLFASFVVFYLFLRYLELTNLLFAGLMLALFLTVELFVYKKR